MAIAERFFLGLDRFLFRMNDFLFPAASGHYCFLETADGDLDHALVGQDGSLVSLIEVRGATAISNDAALIAQVNRMEVELATRLSGPGHAVQVVFDYDPFRATEDVSRSIDPARATAARLGIDLNEVLTDWAGAVASYCAAERTWFVLWTRPSCLSPAERKLEYQRRGKNIAQCPVDGAQQPMAALDGLRDRHSAFVAGFHDTLGGSGILCRVLDAHDSLAAIRRAADPDATGPEWRARIPGDPLPLVAPAPGQKNDLSLWLYPPLADQLFPREALVPNATMLQLGDRLHAPLMMTLAPNSDFPKPIYPFARLFGRLLQRPFPWRASFFLGGDGEGSLGIRPALSAVLSVTSATNKKFLAAVEALRARSLDNQCLVQFQVMFDTWVPAKGEDMAKQQEKLRTQRSMLLSAIQAWGTSDATDAIGDPLLGVSSTLPSVMPKSPAPVSCAPLSDALSLLPLSRPTSAWDVGSLPLRSPDGKLLPYTPGSSMQAAWIDITVAAMGGGKSVTQNAINLAYLLAPGLTELPYLSIIDIGPSSKALVELLSYFLPPAQKHYAVYRRLRMLPEYAINPCDTPLGCRKPLPLHLGFLVNFMSLLATPIDKVAPPDGVTGIARTCIKRAYDDLSPGHHPKPYEPGISPQLAEAVAAVGMHVDAHTSWWEVADALFAAGHTHEAVLAQRFAVPTIADIAAQANSQEVTGKYGDKIFEGEALAKFFWRSVVDAISAWPILAGATRFDLGEARVISLDLNEVAQPGSAAADRQAAVMYMLARFVCANKFFMSPDDAAELPEQYRERHVRVAQALAAAPKRLEFEEFHRVKRAGPLLDEIWAMARESRKWNVHLAFVSQDIDDFPKQLHTIATSYYILAGAPQEARHIAEILKLPPGSEAAIQALRPPGPAGAQMVSVFLTKEGQIVQRVVNTLGPMLLWSLSTTAEDRAVRDRLYAQVDPGRALRLLADRYPGGIKREVERRRGAMEIQTGGGNEEDVMDVIVRELVEESQKRHG